MFYVPCPAKCAISHGTFSAVAQNALALLRFLVFHVVLHISSKPSILAHLDFRLLHIHNPLISGLIRPIPAYSTLCTNAPTRPTASESWCAREDLNLQPLRDQILSLARLPFRHARNRYQVAPRAAESQARFCSARLRKPEGLFRFMSCHFGSGW